MLTVFHINTTLQRETTYLYVITNSIFKLTTCECKRIKAICGIVIESLALI